MRRSKSIIKYPQSYYSGFRAAREWNNCTIASKFYMIQYGDLDRNVDRDEMLPLMAEWDAEDYVDEP